MSFIENLVKEVESLFKPTKVETPVEDTAHEKDPYYVEDHQSTYEGYPAPDSYAGDGIPPIPVKIITEEPTVDVPKGAAWFTSAHHVIRTASATQQGGGQIVSSRDPRKRAVTIVNNGVDFIVIGSNPALSVSQGGNGRIKAGQAITLDTTSDVYAMANTDLTDVDVFAEYETGGGD